MYEAWLVEESFTVVKPEIIEWLRAENQLTFIVAFVNIISLKVFACGNFKLKLILITIYMLYNTICLIIIVCFNWVNVVICVGFIFYVLFMIIYFI